MTQDEQEFFNTALLVGTVVALQANSLMVSTATDMSHGDMLLADCSYGVAAQKIITAFVRAAAEKSEYADKYVSDVCKGLQQALKEGTHAREQIAAARAPVTPRHDPT